MTVFFPDVVCPKGVVGCALLLKTCCETALCSTSYPPFSVKRWQDPQNSLKQIAYLPYNTKLFCERFFSYNLILYIFCLWLDDIPMAECLENLLMGFTCSYYKLKMKTSICLSTIFVWVLMALQFYNMNTMKPTRNFHNTSKIGTSSSHRQNLYIVIQKERNPRASSRVLWTNT